ncbi:hypothetical protein BCU12_13010 [Vibrio sp. 10N.261.55.A7]|nr:hypothetical protein BCU12_13010 [Vibrio sp. 10N.261.55.A7]
MINKTLLFDKIKLPFCNNQRVKPMLGHKRAEIRTMRLRGTRKERIFEAFKIQKAQRYAGL